MLVTVGYSERPSSTDGGSESAREAVNKSGRASPCDLALLFYTSLHDPKELLRAVTSVLGQSVRVVGGGAVGAITNDRFGYAGDQVVIACFWLDGIEVDILSEGGLREGERAVGERLGRRLAHLGVSEHSPVTLFYDAIDRVGGGMRLLMATRLLAGIEDGLGFLPDIAGAGMMGDYACTAVGQIAGGDGVAAHHAVALAYRGDIRIDTAIMHGCQPATGYYRITEASDRTILGINGKPALQFIDDILDHTIPHDRYPLFLIFGVNSGDKWGEFDEDKYASRLCLGIDEERNGIIMFEPDMVEGTEFQIMYPKLETDYIAPKVDAVFDNLAGRKPVFALYINCAGRAAGYNGEDAEDAIALQKAVADRAPILGMYSGVEIARIGGRPRGLDWTGVFSLFSVPE
ncbi:hypothetical protein FACS1894216_03690 [Synergistales bacterium]|nr:hypothetical protein FACS1894216_03690 [Synergistales bacterium]